MFPLGIWNDWSGIGNSVIFTDGVNASPLPTASTTYDLIVPSGAFKLVVKAVGGAVRVSRTTIAGYYELAANEVQEFDVAGHQPSNGNFETTIRVHTQAGASAPYFFRTMKK